MSSHNLEKISKTFYDFFLLFEESLDQAFDAGLDKAAMRLVLKALKASIKIHQLFLKPSSNTLQNVMEDWAKYQESIIVGISHLDTSGINTTDMRVAYSNIDKALKP